MQLWRMPLRVVLDISLVMDSHPEDFTPRPSSRYSRVLSSEACHIDYFCCEICTRFALGTARRRHIGSTPESSPITGTVSRKGGDEGGKEERREQAQALKQALQPCTHRPLDTPLISGFLTYFKMLNLTATKKNSNCYSTRTLLPFITIFQLPTLFLVENVFSYGERKRKVP
jgi:hypothetical protein